MNNQPPYIDKSQKITYNTVCTAPQAWACQTVFISPIYAKTASVGGGFYVSGFKA